MAILKIAHLGNPILRQVAEPVSPEAIGAPEIQKLIDDMLETMAEHDGAGLAAPQVHVSRRVVIYGVEQNPRYPDAEAVPLTVLINPKLTPVSEEQD
jgi:peptide deformylase